MVMILSQKSKIIAFSIVFFVTILLTSSLTSNIFGAPKHQFFDDPNARCWTQPGADPGTYGTTCCWTEIVPGDPEGIEMEYCQHCLYNPNTKTHYDCGEATQPRGPSPDVGRISPDNGNNLPVLKEEPNQTPPQFDDEIKADAPRVDIIEQTPQSDTGSNDEDNEETTEFDIQRETNVPIDNDTSE